MTATFEVAASSVGVSGQSHGAGTWRGTKAAGAGGRSFIGVPRVCNPRATRHRGGGHSIGGSQVPNDTPDSGLMPLAAAVRQPHAQRAEFDDHRGRTMENIGDCADRLFAIVRRPNGKLMNLCQGPSPSGRCSRAETGRGSLRWRTRRRTARWTGLIGS
jgi:hypothetical protein